MAGLHTALALTECINDPNFSNAQSTIIIIATANIVARHKYTNNEKEMVNRLVACQKDITSNTSGTKASSLQCY